MKSMGAAKFPGTNTAPTKSPRLRRINNSAQNVLTCWYHELWNGEVFTGLHFNICFSFNPNGSRTVVAKSN